MIHILSANPSASEGPQNTEKAHASEHSITHQQPLYVKTRFMIDSIPYNVA